MVLVCVYCQGERLDQIPILDGALGDVWGCCEGCLGGWLFW